MGTPDCNRHADAVRTIELLLASAQAVGDVREYLVSYRGARFDTAADRGAVNAFTAGTSRPSGT